MFEIEFQFRMGVRRARLVGHVGGQALGRGQTGPLTDQQHRNLGSEQLADFVQHAHPAVTDHERISDGPPARPRSFVKQGQERRNLRGNR